FVEVVAAAYAVVDCLDFSRGQCRAVVVPGAVAAAADVAERHGGRAGRRVGRRGQRQLPLQLVVGGDRAGLVHGDHDRVVRVGRRGRKSGVEGEGVAAGAGGGDVRGR